MTAALLLLLLKADALPPPRTFNEALERASDEAAARTNQRFADRERAMIEELRRVVKELTPR